MARLRCAAVTIDLEEIWYETPDHEPRPVAADQPLQQGPQTRTPHPPLPPRLGEPTNVREAALLDRGQVTTCGTLEAICRQAGILTEGEQTVDEAVNDLIRNLKAAGCPKPSTKAFDRWLRKHPDFAEQSRLLNIAVSVEESERALGILSDGEATVNEEAKALLSDLAKASAPKPGTMAFEKWRKSTLSSMVASPPAFRTLPAMGGSANYDCPTGTRTTLSCFLNWNHSK